jgi:hypothetical protein
MLLRELLNPVDEGRKKRRRSRPAAYGPGPYGYYGYYPGYSGDSGAGEGGDGGGMEENFADGRNPQDKGDSKRHGVPTKASVSTLRKVAKQGGRKGQLAHWMANMKAGKAKKENVEITMKQSLYESIVATDFMSAMKDFLPIAMHVLKIEKLPRIKLMKNVGDQHQPTFGRFNNDELIIDIGLSNRHPNDILRTLAHELVHFKQMLDNQIGPHSGDTGSPEENEAHAVAGVIMRHFNKTYPQYLSSKPIELQETATAGATSAGNVTTGPFVKNKRAKKQPVGHNALDGDNLLAIGGVVKR